MDASSAFITKIARDNGLPFEILLERNANPLESLALLLFDRDKCFHVARAFAPLLPQLLEICDEKGCEYQKFISLSSLIGYFRYSTQFVYRVWGNNKHSPLPFALPQVPSSVSKRRKIDGEQNLEVFLQACLRYLWYDLGFFYHRFDWSVLFSLDPLPNNECLFLLRHIVKLILHHSPEEFECQLKMIPEESLNRYRLKYAFLHETRVPIDSDYQNSDMVTLLSHLNNLLSPRIVNINGILMYRANSQSTHDTKSPLILVDSVLKCVTTLAESVASAIPCIVEGPVGCGKTSLVEYLALLTGHSSDTLTRVQMGDQIDSKSLIGNYHCTEIPGEFIWRAGPLTDTMVRGSWLLIEDIDAASADVVSTIVSALRCRQLSSLPGCNVTGHIHGDFRIFFTRRLDRAPCVNEIDSIACKITIEPMSVEELGQVLSQLYPSMKNLFPSILRTYALAQTCVGDEVTAFSQFASKPLTSRIVSLRDLLKWVKRIHSYHRNNEDNLAALVFSDAVDCFIPDPTFQMSKVEALGTHLNLSKQQAHSLCFSNPCEPRLDSQDVMFVGRARLERSPVDRLTSYCLSRNSSFALTVPTLLLMERIAVSLSHNEPVLLVGETGCGKTSVVQYLADRLGQKLTVVNLNQQSDSADLIGGYKPVDLSFLMEPIRLSFQSLVTETFSKNNDVFLGKINQCFSLRRYKDLVQLVRTVAQKVMSTQSKPRDLKNQWKCLVTRAQALASKFLNDNERQALLAFAFVEGSLVKCVREGSWILLDEINLAEPDTLHSLSALLDTCAGDQVTLVNKADGLPIVRHPNFRVFACMNPATDVGKRDLPLGIRHRFTEFYVDEISQRNDLNLLIAKYLPSYHQPNKLVDLYSAAKEAAREKLVDSTGHRPHYSLRTLCRALAVASSNPCRDVSRSLYESFAMSFLTQLSNQSKELMTSMITSCILGDSSKSVLGQAIVKSPETRSLQFEGFWVPIGSEQPQLDNAKYIFTDCIRKNLKDLARAVSIGKTFPILIQGDTSVGKTSLISWLARASGNVCRRVNNHEHTDLEEYIGSYVTDETGNLVFKEGVLVEAMRKGYWIILDELNLAPTEILEALNRLLDDNRELFIAETRTLVKAHPSFLLFATQNPPGLYGGRKMLSRAFRNRFIELHFEEIPKDQLAHILERRCRLPKSHAVKMVRVMSDLQMKRRSSLIFAGKAGFITLRDLFRWGDRHVKSSESISESFYDWDMHLASTGYMLLAGKVRTEEEAELVRQVLESHFLRKKQTLDPLKLVNDQFASLSKRIYLQDKFSHLVATPSFKRLVVLLWNAFIHKEPVLLVGQTGCGKTTACQLFSQCHGQPISIINCHMNSDGSDFIGSLRPVRDHSSHEQSSGKLFEWVDGPLVKAIKDGHIFLIDEISLADDSVLERLNSLLEPERTLFLAEKSGADHHDALCVAHESFLLAATMNPGDDFGKKELSPALRNRFTEIWCCNLTSEEEFQQVILQNLAQHLTSNSSAIASIMSSFYFWFHRNFSRNKSISFRDILSWIEFVNTVSSSEAGRVPVDIPNAIFQGAHLVLLDSLGCDGSSLSSSADASSLARRQLIRIITEQLKELIQNNSSWILENEGRVTVTESHFGISPFFIMREANCNIYSRKDYSFNSPGVTDNCFKILRAMQLKKPILLEGSPGVGKTSLVAALARVSGHQVVRINLSEQSDISDLFGCDLPIEGDDTAGKFEWRDGPLLIALRSPRTWIMLDELNLAPQSVLEGLNSCLDHRGEIFIPELGRTFILNQCSTRILATQNPQSQGGDRRGLPRSFLNRFTNVYINPFNELDLATVARDTFADLPKECLTLLVRFNGCIDNLCREHRIGLSGSPFEFNFRDISRVCLLLSRGYPLQHAVEIIYVCRFRSDNERNVVIDTFQNIFNATWINSSANLLVTPQSICLPFISSVPRRSLVPHLVTHTNLEPYDMVPMRNLLTCIDMNWLTLLVAPSSSEPSRVAEKLATLTGNQLKTFSVHPELDALELLGGFEKKSMRRQVNLLDRHIRETTLRALNCFYRINDMKACSSLWQALVTFHQSIHVTDENLHIDQIRGHLDKLKRLWTLSPNNLSINHELINALIESVAKLCKVSLTGTFEWVDSPIVSAAKEGHWLFIEGANLCAASVIDRLNSLFETEAFLLLSEKGSDCHNGLQIVHPHPNFRVIMSVDPSKGEMSRAMRNRGVEIFIDATLFPSIKSVDVSSLAADPLVTRVLQFGLHQRLTGEHSSNCIVASLFLERSSPADISLRYTVLRQSLGISDAIRLPHLLNCPPYEPYDRRTLLIPNPLPQDNGRLNFWHLQNFLMLSQTLSVQGLINSPLLRLSTRQDVQIDEQQMQLLKVYGVVRLRQWSASEIITGQLSRRLSSRLQEYCESLVIAEDLFDSEADAWERLLLKSTISTSLVHDATSGEALSRLIDLFYMYRSNIAKYIEPMQSIFSETALKLYQRSHDIAQPLQQLTEIVASHTTSDADSEALTHHEESLFETLITLLVEKRSIHDAVTVGGGSLHPLRVIFSNESPTFTCERLLYHLLDSRLFFDYCHKLQLSPKSQEFTCVLSVLICKIISSKQFTLKNISLRIDLLKKMSSCLMKHFHLLTIEPSSGDFDHSHERLMDEWLRHLILYETRHHMQLKLSRLQQSPLSVGYSEVQLGLLTCQSFIPISQCDPSELRHSELEHLQVNLARVNEEIVLRRELAREEIGPSYDPQLPLFLASLVQTRDHITQQMDQVSSSIVYRMTPRYKTLQEQMMRFKESVLDPCSRVNSGTVNAAAHVNETYARSCSSFATSLLKDFVDYYDIINPFVTGLLFTAHGLEAVSKGPEKRCPALDSLVNLFAHSSSSFAHFSEKPFSTLLQNSPDYVEIKSYLTIYLLGELHLEMTSRKCDKVSVIIRANQLLEEFVVSWHQMKEQEKATKEAEDALVHYKVHESAPTDEEVDSQTLNSVFPSFTCVFSDIVEQPEDNSHSTNAAIDERLSRDTLGKLVALNTDLFLKPSASCFESTLPLRYRAISCILSSDWVGSLRLPQGNCLPLHLVSLSNTLRQVSIEKDAASIDVYHETDSAEMTVCSSLLLKLDQQVDSMLLEFPDHPTLTKVSLVTKRILSFDARSPLIKYLTGLELLLEVIRDWDSNYAHRAIKLSDHEASITQLIIKWRKLQLNQWAQCLDRLLHDTQTNDQIQWWFQLFNLLSCFETCNKEQLVASLRQLITTSSIATFGVRLNLLLAFSRQSLLIDGAQSSKFILLRNVSLFYLQCQSCLDEKLNAERKVIDEQVKQFVSLMRWTDMNYYSLRETIHKSHKTLTRFMRKFATCISLPSVEFLKLPPNMGVDERPLDQINNAFAHALQLSTIDLPQDPINEYHLPLLFSKMKSFSIQIKRTLSLVQSGAIDDLHLARDLMVRISQFRELSVDSKIKDKDEYTKAAHFISNSKRQRLSDLFKLLGERGFKWSHGSNNFSQYQVNHLLITVAPVLMLPQQVDNITDKYYYSCLYRFEKLKHSILTASKELNASILSRITGFAGLLLSQLVEQRQVLSSLALLHEKLSSVFERPRISLALEEREKKIRQLVTRTELLLKKIKVFLANCCVDDEENAWKDFTSRINICNAELDTVELPSPASDYECEVALKVCRDCIVRSIDCFSSHRNHITRELCSLQEQLQALEENRAGEAADSIDHISCFLVPLLKSIEQLVKLNKETQMDENSSPLQWSRVKKYFSQIQIEQLTLYLHSLQKCRSTCPDFLTPFREQFQMLLGQMICSLSSAHFSLGKVFHILLDLFDDLATRGLCLPPEFDDGKSSGRKEAAKDGIGLDEQAKGTKDVSDRITSQDELEGLMKDQQSQQDQEQDVEEEENAVDYDDDFDGKEYDAPGKSGDEQDEEDSDAENKMGSDVDEENDVLDKKMWQDDEENCNEPEMDEEADETGRGEEYGEDQIVAKDDTLGNREKEEDSKDDNISKMNEKNEMNDEYEGETIDPHKGEHSQESEANDDEPVDLGNMKLEQDESSGEEDSDDGDDPPPSDDDTPVTNVEQEVPSSDSEFQDDSERVDHQLAEQDEDMSEDAKMTDERLEENLESHPHDRAQVTDDSTRKNPQNSQSVERTDESEAMNQVEQESALDDQKEGSSQVNGSDENGGEAQNARFASGSTEERNRLARLTETRSVAKNDEQSKKKRKIVQKQSALTVEDASHKQSEMFRHIADDEKSDDEVMDTAVDENDAKTSGTMDQDLNAEPEDEDVTMPEVQEEPEEPSPGKKVTETIAMKTKRDKVAPAEEKNSMAKSDTRKMEDEIIHSNHDVMRAGETTCHTNTNTLLLSGASDLSSLEQRETLRVEHGNVSNERKQEAASLWSECSRQVDSLVFELCQQLQLVLEPAKCAKLKGDYRTGKRINMRKVIAFIASQFRKDKIWLRRTKPSKRTYQIVLAVDDSGSMIENQCKAAAVQSLALLSRALALIEAGQLAVVRFGEEPVLLQSLEQQFTESQGPRILESFTFQQKKTNIAALVRQVSSLFASSRSLHTTYDHPNQLMIVISDGRGVFDEGKSCVQAAVREMIDRGIFCLFLLIDNPTNQQSIFDIDSFSFEDGKLVRSSYMDQFPFPFYLVVRNLNTLPLVLGESLRQWFQLVTHEK